MSQLFGRAPANGHTRFGSRGTRALSKAIRGIKKEELDGALRALEALREPRSGGRHGKRRDRGSGNR